MLKAATPEEKDAVLKSYLDLIKELPQKDGSDKKVKEMRADQDLQSYLWRKTTYTDIHGNVLGTYIEQITFRPKTDIESFLNPEKRRQKFEDAWRTRVERYTPGDIRTSQEELELPGHPKQMVNATTEFISGRYIGDQGFGPQGELWYARPYDPSEFAPIARDEAKELSYRSLTDPALSWTDGFMYGDIDFHYYNDGQSAALACCRNRSHVLRFLNHGSRRATESCRCIYWRNSGSSCRTPALRFYRTAFPRLIRRCSYRRGTRSRRSSASPRSTCAPSATGHIRWRPRTTRAM
ncbi:hypothetical protein [Selenomonas sp. F0473]|uniref:hypothetical protein n=1 Tax=Selenomonas sp. F0473 TaxID=999423 RepID=UPI0002D522C7